MKERRRCDEREGMREKKRSEDFGKERKGKERGLGREKRRERRRLDEKKKTNEESRRRRCKEEKQIHEKR